MGATGCHNDERVNILAFVTAFLSVLISTTGVAPRYHCPITTEVVIAFSQQLQLFLLLLRLACYGLDISRCLGSKIVTLGKKPPSIGGLFLS